MKILIVTFLIFVAVSGNLCSQTTWIEQITGYSINHTVECVHFFNAQTGILGGGFGVFAKTTNGGINWVHINNNPDNHYHSISFINNNTGWIAGGYYNSNYIMEMVRKTTNGGLTWDSLYFDIYARIWDIQFLNDTTGFMVGKYIKKTTNSGINWFVIDDNSIWMNQSIFFINDLKGWAGKYYSDTSSGKAYTKIIKTTNGGLNWIMQLYDSSYSNINFTDFQFLNENTGYATNTTNGVYKTTNGGQNWINVSSVSSNYKLFFLNENTGWVGSWNYIRKTTNGGLNWLSEFLYQGCFFRGMYFINDLTGWASGMTNITQPKLYKTTNGGITLIKQISEVTRESYLLSQNYPNPFNSTSNFKFEIAKLSNVKIAVFDVSGREVETLVNEQLQPGTYTTQWNASAYSSGVYFYRIQSGDFSETKRMLLIK